MQSSSRMNPVEALSHIREVIGAQRRPGSNYSYIQINLADYTTAADFAGFKVGQSFEKYQKQLKEFQTLLEADGYLVRVNVFQAEKFEKWAQEKGVLPLTEDAIEYILSTLAFARTQKTYRNAFGLTPFVIAISDAPEMWSPNCLYIPVVLSLIHI